MGMVTSRPTPLRILAVDDEASMLAFVARVLMSAGHEVVLASDAHQALQLVAAQDRPFDVFVLDVMMPQIRGDELARELRQRDPNVKVLYLTGYPDKLFEGRTLLETSEAFVEKPVTIQGLLEALSLLVSGRTDKGQAGVSRWTR